MAAVVKKANNMLRKLKKEFEESKQSLRRLRNKFSGSLSKGLERKWVAKAIKAEAALREAKRAAGVDPGEPELVEASTGNTSADGRSTHVGSQSSSKRKAESDLDTEASPKRLKCDTPAQEPSKLAEKLTRKRKEASLHEEETKPRKKSKQESSRPVGLTNHRQACFSNVVIQTLAAATSNQNLDTLFGRPSSAETFGMTSASLGKLGKSSRLSTRRLGSERKKLRSVAKSSAAAGESGKVSVIKHLRLLLQDMKAVDKDVAACPYLFQTVLAFGGPEGLNPVREEMSGDSQEDCHEYFTTVLSALEADPLAHNAAGVNAIFELETEIRDVCQSDCGHETTSEVSKSNYHPICVPSHADDNPLDLQSLLETSLKSESDRLCARCKTGTIRRTTAIRTAPEALVIKVDRLSFDRKKGRVQKSKVAIDFSSSDDIRFDAHQYQLNAVIMHDGTTPQRGHYTIFRRDDDDWWLLNDDKVVSVSQDQIKDGTKRGESAMLLLKKISKA